jgi:hypothetical protein
LNNYVDRILPFFDPNPAWTVFYTLSVDKNRHFFSAVYNQERLILQTIYVLTKQGNVGLKSAVYNQE